LATELQREGLRPGDPEYERHGIFCSVTYSRCKYTVSGQRDGTMLDGTHLGGRDLSDGFEENVEFLDLKFVDPDQLAYRRDLGTILPVLWMRAGAFGDYGRVDPKQVCIPADRRALRHPH